MNLRHIVLVPVVALAIAACNAPPKTQTRTYNWPDGRRMAQETYYNKVDPKASPYDASNVLHGPSTYWNTSGIQIAQGVWKDGKPYSGTCWIPGNPNPRSAQPGHFEKFAEGKSLGEVPAPN